MSALDIARRYLERGWHPVPIARGSKGPTKKGWQKQTITLENVGKHFNGSDQNIGVQLGPKSGGLADVDLDCPEAVALAADFLPDTNAIFGRKSKPCSHYLYYVVDPEPTAAIKLVDDEGEAIIELRLGGGDAGAQTVFPGSMNPSGEMVEWDAEGEPQKASCAALKAAITKIAVASLLMRGWPSQGSRHETAMATGGFLARAGWNLDDIEEMIEAVATKIDARKEIKDRVKAALDSAERVQRGDAAYGLPALRERIGEAIANRIAQLLGYREGGADEQAIIEELNNEYFLVNVSGKVRVMRFRTEVMSNNRGTRHVAEFLSAPDFKLIHCNRTISVRDDEGKAKRVAVGEWWLKHRGRRQYLGGLRFLPDQPKEIGDVLNLWRGWGVEPKAGDWSLMRSHIREVLAGGEKAYSDYIIKWLGWKVQNPGLPPEVALVFKGDKGTGKGVLGRAFCNLFGQHGLQIFSSGHLAGKFNAHLMDCAVLLADEAYWPGDPAVEGALKGIITEPTIPIEPKGVNLFSIDNTIALIILTNADWVVPASHDERRYAVFDVLDVRRGDKEYFDALYRELENGGLAAMLFDLKAMDLKGWHPRHDVPQTKALQEQKLLSLKPVDQYWLSLLKAGVLPEADKNPYKTATSALYDQAVKTVPGVRRMSLEVFGKLLSKIAKARGCKVYRGNARGWEFPELAEARAAWSKRIPTEWDDDQTVWASIGAANYPDSQGR